MRSPAPELTLRSYMHLLDNSQVKPIKLECLQTGKFRLFTNNRECSDWRTWNKDKCHPESSNRKQAWSLMVALPHSTCTRVNSTFSHPTARPAVGVACATNPRPSFSLRCTVDNYWIQNKATGPADTTNYSQNTFHALMYFLPELTKGAAPPF